MSAITSLGYPDWQRLTVWDGPILWAVPPTATTGAITSPIMEASRYAFIGGSALVTNGLALLRLTWYADQALTNQVGQRDIRLASGYGGVGQFHIPNLGPYCRAQFTSLNGLTYTAQIQLFMSNRQYLTDATPIDPILYNVSAFTLGNAASIDTKPLQAYAGPAMAYLNNPAVNWVFNFHALGPSGNFDSFAIFQPAASGRSVVPIFIPLHSWSVLITNLSGASGSFDLAVVAATSGAT